jgi:trigger factor
VKEVKEKVLPALDDDFAKSVGGDFETLEALRDEVRKGLEARREAENRRALEATVLDAVLAGHTFEVPEALVLRQVGHQVEHAREHMRRQGVDPDRIPWDYKKLLEDLRPGAEKAVKRALLIEAIASREGLQPADADVEAEVERLAQASQRPAPAVRRMLEQSGDLEGIRHTLGERRTVDFLIEKNQANTA